MTTTIVSPDHSSAGASGAARPDETASSGGHVDATLVASIRGLRVVFETDRGPIEAVRGIDLDIRQGEAVAIVGESGSGKSVTARALTGLLATNSTLTADHLKVVGTDVLSFTETQWRRLRGRRIGLVVQDALTSLDPVRPLGKEVGEVLTTHRLTRGRATKRRVVELLESVGIPEPELRASQYPHQLSGGLRQRGLIAVGLAGEPELLIADEPTTALDVTVQAQILDLLAEKKALGTTILLISHDLAVVAQIADRVIVMRNGTVVEAGLTKDVLTAPRTDYTRELLRAIPSRSSRGFRLSGGHEPSGGDSDEGDSLKRVPLSPRAVDLSVPVLSASHLRKEYRHAGSHLLAVDDVSFTVHAGETLGIVGESGSGKTTVARIALGLIEPDTGEVRLGDDEWSGISESRRRALRRDVQFIAQDPLSSFDPRYNVGRIIAESLAAAGVPREERPGRIAEVLELVRLDASYADRHPRSLSGGQRQRISIARALAPRPKLVIADEPVSALDVSVQAQILDLLADLQAELGTAILFISHDLGVVHHIADQVVVMKSGQVVESGATDDVFSRPQHPYSQQLLAALPPLERI